MAPAMPCKGWFISESRKWCRAMTKQRISKQCMVVQWNSHQSTRQRVECSLLTKHEDRIAGNGFFSLTHYHLVRKLIPDATSDEDSGCKSCSGKEMEEDPNDSSLEVGQSQVQKVGYSGSTKRQNKSSLLHWKNVPLQKNAELEPKTSEVQRQIRVPLGHCKRRLWSSSSFFWNWVRLRPRWLPQQSWTLLQYYQGGVMQYLSTR